MADVQGAEADTRPGTTVGLVALHRADRIGGLRHAVDRGLLVAVGLIPTSGRPERYAAGYGPVRRRLPQDEESRIAERSTRAGEPESKNEVEIMFSRNANGVRGWTRRNCVPFPRTPLALRLNEIRL